MTNVAKLFALPPILLPPRYALKVFSRAETEPVRIFQSFPPFSIPYASFTLSHPFPFCSNAFLFACYLYSCIVRPRPCWHWSRYRSRQTKVLQWYVFQRQRQTLLQDRVYAHLHNLKDFLLPGLRRVSSSPIPLKSRSQSVRTVFFGCTKIYSLRTRWVLIESILLERQPDSESKVINGVDVSAGISGYMFSFHFFDTSKKKKIYAVGSDGQPKYLGTPWKGNYALNQQASLT